MSTKQERWALFDRAVFRTITGADWRVSIAEARAAPNSVRDQVREAIRRAGLAQADSAAESKILALGLGKSESGNVGKINPERL